MISVMTGIVPGVMRIVSFRHVRDGKSDDVIAVTYSPMAYATNRQKMTMGNFGPHQRDRPLRAGDSDIQINSVHIQLVTMTNVE